MDRPVLDNTLLTSLSLKLLLLLPIHVLDKPMFYSFWNDIVSIWIILIFWNATNILYVHIYSFQYVFLKSLILNVITYIDVWKPVVSPDRMVNMRSDKLNCIGSRIVMIFFLSCWNNYTVIFGPLWCTNCLRAKFLINNAIL